MYALASDGRQILSRTWMIFFERMGGSAASRGIVYGTHAQRLDVPPDEVPDGGIWVETDRGNVLYQLQDGVWWYLAGTMFGTLDPDQRPTDLGAHDVGFDFRTSVTPAREFIWSDDSWIEVTPCRYGTHAERLAQPADLTAAGTLWVETDRGNVLYQLQEDELWWYLAGTMRNTLADKPADLGTNDTGFLFYGTDYVRTWRWTGTAWEYAPGERLAKEINWYPGTVPAGWALCDGSAITVTLSTAATASFSTPDLTGQYAKGGTYTGAVIAGTDGSISGATATESAHTHTVDIPLWATQGPDVATITAQAGTGVAVAPYHAHYFDIPAATSGAGSAHSHGAGTLSVTGSEPAHVLMLPIVKL